MASEKAIYWSAVVVAALILGGQYANKFDGQCLPGRLQAAVQRLSGHSERLLSVAEVMMGRQQTQFASAESAVARAQCKLASVENMMARQQTACARIEAQRARMAAMQQVQQIRFQTAFTQHTLQLQIPPVARMPHDGTI